MRIPILMYHSISVGEDAGVHPYFVTHTPGHVFESHLRFLRDHGYRAISTGEVVRMLNSPTPTEDKLVAITFDDGYRDFYTCAFPILEKYGFRATVYLPTGYINHRARNFNERECLTWPEVRELRRSGIEFGSHTASHRQLRFVSLSDLEYELGVSKQTLEDELGEAITSFSYPYAFPEDDQAFVHRLRDLLRVCGYTNGVSTIIGSAHSLEDCFFLRRLPANSADDLALFQAKLNGDYDWLHAAQKLKKMITKGVSRKRVAERSRTVSTSG